MRKLLVSLIFLANLSVFAQYNPTFDTVRLRRGGKLYEMITYGEDSVKINGVMYRMGSGGGGYWQTSGAQAIMPDPTNKIIKLPSMPSIIATSVPSTWRPVYWDEITGYLNKWNGTAGGGGGGSAIDGDTLTGCDGVYAINLPAQDITISIDSIANICGCLVVKNIGVGSTVTIDNLEGLPFDTLGTQIVLEYNEWVSICADSTYFVTMGISDLASKISQWPIYYDGDTAKINKASATDSGYLTAEDHVIFTSKEKGKNVVFVSKKNPDADYTELSTALNAAIPNQLIIVDALDSTETPYLKATVTKPGVHIMGLGSCYYDRTSGSIKGKGARVADGILVMPSAPGVTIENISIDVKYTTGWDALMFYSSNCKVKDCLIVGKKLPSGIHNTHHGISFASYSYSQPISGFVASNCRVYGQFHGFVVKGSDANLVNCYAENTFSEGLIIKGGENSSKIRNVNVSNFISKTTSGDTTGYGILIQGMSRNGYGVENVNLSNITVSKAYWAGIGIFAGDTAQVKYINISNLTVDTASLAGIYIDTATYGIRGTIYDIKVTNGSFNNTPYGISIPNVKTGNVFYSNCKGGITSLTNGVISTYEPEISAGTTAQYWRGDKTWQSFPAVQDSTDNPFKYLAGNTVQRQSATTDTLKLNRNVKFTGNDGFIQNKYSTTDYAYVYLNGFGGSMQLKAAKDNGPIFSNAYTQQTFAPAAGAMSFDFSTGTFGTYQYQLDEYGFYPTDYTTAGTYNQYLGTPSQHWNRGYIDTLNAITMLTTGKVGVNRTNPSTALDVNGVITATGGNSTQWNDAATDNEKNYGFLESYKGTLSFNATDSTLTLTPSSSIKWFSAGALKTITVAKTKKITGTAGGIGTYYFYFDASDTTISVSVNPWTLNDTKIPIAYVMWNKNAPGTYKYWLADERHSNAFSRREHLWAHSNIGSRYTSGGQISGESVLPVTASSADNQFKIAAATMMDEDIIHTLAVKGEPTTTSNAWTMFYRTAASTWTWDTTAVPYPYSATYIPVSYNI